MPQTPILVHEPLIAEAREIILETEQDFRAYIALKAPTMGLDASLVEKVVSCESSFNPRALGDSNQSRGLAQIHKPSHPDITDEEAYDPRFALDFLMENMADGKGKMWTCWRKYQ